MKRLETPRLYMRPMTVADAAALHAIYSDHDTMAHMPRGTSHDLDATRQRVQWYMEHQQQHGFSIWAVIDRDTGTLIGDCGLFLVEGRGPEVEVVCRLGSQHWGRGYAPEAVAEMLRFGRDTLGLRRIVALAPRGHERSLRVCEKVGMHQEGNGKFYDAPQVVYAT